MIKIKAKFKQGLEIRGNIKKSKKPVEFDIPDEHIKKAKQNKATYHNQQLFYDRAMLYGLYWNTEGKMVVVMYHSYNTFEEVTDQDKAQKTIKG